MRRDVTVAHYKHRVQQITGTTELLLAPLCHHAVCANQKHNPTFRQQRYFYSNKIKSNMLQLTTACKHIITHEEDRSSAQSPIARTEHKNVKIMFQRNL